MATGQFGNLPIPWRDDVLAAIGAVAKAGDTMTGPLAVTGISAAANPATSSAQVGQLAADTPVFRWTSAAGSADSKVWEAYTSGNQWNLRAVSDSGGNAQVALRFTRSGLSSSAIIACPLNVTGATTVPILTATAAGVPAMNVRSGVAGSWGAYSIGRTAVEGYLGVSGGASQIFYGDAAGDIGLKAEAGTLRLGIGGQAVVHVNAVSASVNGPPLSGVAFSVRTAASRNVGVFDQSNTATLAGLTDAGSGAALRVVGNGLTLAGTAAAGGNHLYLDNTGGTFAVQTQHQGTIAVTLPAAPTARVGTLAGQFPGMQLVCTGGPADSKTWEAFANQDAMVMRTVNDAYNSAFEFFTARRTGIGVNSVILAGSNIDLRGYPRVFSDNGVRLLNAASSVGGGILAVPGEGTRVSSDANDITMYRANTELARVSPVGLGVGVAPTCKLDVYGNFILARDGTYSGYFGRGTDLVLGSAATDLGIRTASGHIRFATDNGTQRMAILSTGGIPIFTPLSIPKYTQATAPAASAFNGYVIDITDASGGPKTCRSNGSAWLILNTQTAVS